MSKIEAPFANQTVTALNQSQVGVGKGMIIHPFTCANRGDGNHGNEGGDTGVLIATEAGWVCPHCDYVQNWAFSAMATERGNSLPNWLQKRQAEAQPTIVRDRLMDYRSLKYAKPDAPGIGEMLAALQSRAAELDIPA